MMHSMVPLKPPKTPPKTDPRPNTDLCRFWTCRDPNIQPYLHEPFGQKITVALCFDHRGIVAEAKWKKGLDIHVSEEGNLWIDTFSWDLRQKA